jgi:hypothetical protein
MTSLADLRIARYLGLIVCALLASIAIRQCVPEPAFAQMSRREPVPPREWTELAGASMAFLIRHESRSGRDAAAIAWTLARRWWAHHCEHRSFAESVIRTSRYTRAARKRLEHEAAHGMRTDPELRDVLDAWVRGDVADPCRGLAFQWRAPGVGGPGRRVDCQGTSNSFYEHPRTGQQRAIESLARGRETCR